MMSSHGRHMNARRDHRTVARRWRTLGLSGVLLASLGAPGAALAADAGAGGAASASVSAAPLETPSKVIDAQSDPDAAAQALNSGCADLSNCTWSGGTPSIGYGPAEIVGDKLYNCEEPEDPKDPLAGPYAETAAGVTEERKETTSLSEKVSLKISLGFLGFAKSSAEFEAFSKQASAFSSQVEVKNGVPVAPGWVGWTEAQPRSILVTGNAYVTDGINLVEVHDIDMSFPFPNPNDPLGNATYNNFAQPMSEEERATRCDAVGDSPTAARPQPAVATYTLSICTPVHDRHRRVRCTARTATGTPPLRTGRTPALITRDGATEATGIDRDGHIRVTAPRGLTAGRYTLVLRARLDPRGQRAPVTVNDEMPVEIH
jgi:hypothetical protein